MFLKNKVKAYIPGLGAAFWTSGKIPRGTAETTNNHTDKVTTTYCNRFMFFKKKIIISKIAKIANNSNRENQFKNYSGKIVSLSRQRTQGISLLIQNGEICPMSCLLSPTSTCKQLMLMFVDSFFIYIWLRLENKWYGLH